MKKTDFILSLQEFMTSSPGLASDGREKIVFVSDLHLGDGGSRDEGLRNEALVALALQRFYLDRGWTLVLNGDVEELFRFEYPEVVAAHAGLYQIFGRFEAAGRFWKLVGNHDLALLTLKELPWPLQHSLRVEHPDGLLLAYHGHQASSFYSRYHYMSDFLVRYLAHPLRIGNLDRPMTNKRRLGAERRIYQASRALRIASITGHTHRPLFESLGTYDFLRYSLERLILEYQGASEEARPALEKEIRFHAQEIRRMASRYGRRKAPRSLYDRDGVPVPCVFNSGSTIGKQGFTALELEEGGISLVYWTKPGAVRSWITHESVGRFGLSDEHRTRHGDDAVRYLLRRETLSSVFTRIRLLS